MPWALARVPAKVNGINTFILLFATFFLPRLSSSRHTLSHSMGPSQPSQDDNYVTDYQQAARMDGFSPDHVVSSFQNRMGPRRLVPSLPVHLPGLSPSPTASSLYASSPTRNEATTLVRAFIQRLFATIDIPYTRSLRHSFLPYQQLRITQTTSRPAFKTKVIG